MRRGGQGSPAALLGARGGVGWVVVVVGGTLVEAGAPAGPRAGTGVACRGGGGPAIRA